MIGGGQDRSICRMKLTSISIVYIQQSLLDLRKKMFEHLFLLPSVIPNLQWIKDFILGETSIFISVHQNFFV